MKPALLEPPVSRASARVAGSPAGASASQWELVRRKFRRHRVAVYSLWFLGLLYCIALFAEFFAPYGQGSRSDEWFSSPPMLPRFTPADGFFIWRTVRHQDPITLRSYYLRTDDKIPLGFFVRGEPYRMWGWLPGNLHFFGATAAAGAAPEERPFVALLGTDRFGHDVLSRIIHGARISLSIGLVSIVFTFALGLAIGGVSGYCGGKADLVIQRLIEIVNSFPQLPLWMALGAVFPPTWSPLATYFATTVVLSLVAWTGLARVVRGGILSLREQEYAMAARLVGAGHTRILFRHLVPGFASHIIVTLTLTVPAMILGETAMSFLGLGLRPPVVSWGVMLQDCLHLERVGEQPWILLPMLFIALTVLAFNFLGDGLRDAADPYATR